MGKIWEKSGKNRKKREEKEKRKKEIFLVRSCPYLLSMI